MQYILLGDVKNCNKCPLSLDIDGKCKMNLCRGSEENNVNPDSSKKPSWCPLKELPLHKNMERLTARTNDGRGVCGINASCTCDSTCDYMRNMINKLAEYEDMEDQDRLVKLPCAVGDTVYKIVKIPDYGELGDRTEFIYRIDEAKFDYNAISLLEKSVFLTREQAEQALQAIKQEQS